MNKKDLMDEQTLKQKFGQSIIPILTDKVNNKPALVLELIEDFMPVQFNQNGHQQGCSCKACQPLKAVRNENSVKNFTKPLEANVPSFRNPHQK